MERREVNWGEKRDWMEAIVIYVGVRRVKLNDKPGQGALVWMHQAVARRPVSVTLGPRRHVKSPPSPRSGTRSLSNPSEKYLPKNI